MAGIEGGMDRMGKRQTPLCKDIWKAGECPRRNRDRGMDIDPPPRKHEWVLDYYKSTNKDTKLLLHYECTHCKLRKVVDAKDVAELNKSKAEAVPENGADPFVSVANHSTTPEYYKVGGNHSTTPEYYKVGANHSTTPEYYKVGNK